MLLLSTCSTYTKFLYLDRNTGSAVWNKDSTAFAFVVQTGLYRRPVGIAKFPDGGSSKYVYYDVSLYHFDIKKNKLTRLTPLNEYILGYNYRWYSLSYIKLSLTDSILYYKLAKPMNSDLKVIEKEHPEFLEKIAKTYKINLKTLHKDTVKMAENMPAFNKKHTGFSGSEAQYLQNVKCSDWGFDLAKINPQPEAVYKEMIIERKGNENSRECVLQQIVSGFTEEKKKDIVAKMLKKQKKLLHKYTVESKEKYAYKNKRNYLKYTEYLKEISRKKYLPLVLPRENKEERQKEVAKHLKRYNIILPVDDFEFKDITFIGKDFIAELKLKNPDSVSIKKYKNWYHKRVAYLLNNGWISISRPYDEYDTLANGIVISDQITHFWEHTTLKGAIGNEIIYLKPEISYRTGDKKYMTLSITEETEQHNPIFRIK